MILHRNKVTFFLDLPFNGGYEDVQLNPDVIHNMFGMNPGKQMSFGIANEGFGFTVIKIVFSTFFRILFVYKENNDKCYDKKNTV